MPSVGNLGTGRSCTTGIHAKTCETCGIGVEESFKTHPVTDGQASATNVRKIPVPIRTNDEI
jgi:hypothetical protein